MAASADRRDAAAAHPRLDAELRNGVLRHVRGQPVHCRSRSACGRCWPCLPAWRHSAWRCSARRHHWLSTPIRSFSNSPAGLLIAKAWTGGISRARESRQFGRAARLWAALGGQRDIAAAHRCRRHPGLPDRCRRGVFRKPLQAQSVQDAGRARRRVLFDLSVACHRASGRRQAVVGSWVSTAAAGSGWCS